MKFVFKSTNFHPLSMKIWLSLKIFKGISQNAFKSISKHGVSLSPWLFDGDSIPTLLSSRMSVKQTS